MLKKTTLAILASTCLYAMPITAKAQVIVHDPVATTSAAAGFSAQLAKTAAELAKLQQQYVTAQTHLQQAIKNATGLNPTQWAQLQSEFKVVLGAPAFINTTVAQQKQTLAQFERMFPSYKPGANYTAYGQSLASNTQGAAQQAMNAGVAEISAITGEKAKLDSITNYNPKSEQEQLNLEAVLTRQSIEQMEKMRILLANQNSNMGVYFGDMARAATAQQTAKQTATCKSDIQHVYIKAHQLDPNVTLAQVQASMTDANTNNTNCAPVPNAQP